MPRALRYLESIGLDPARAVALIVATHWHDDHIRGMARLVEACDRAAFCCAGALRQEEFLAAVGALENRHLLRQRLRTSRDLPRVYPAPGRGVEANVCSPRPSYFRPRRVRNLVALARRRKLPGLPGIHRSVVAGRRSGQEPDSEPFSQPSGRRAMDRGRRRGGAARLRSGEARLDRDSGEHSAAGPARHRRSRFRTTVRKAPMRKGFGAGCSIPNPSPYSLPGIGAVAPCQPRMTCGGFFRIRRTPTQLRVSGRPPRVRARTNKTVDRTIRESGISLRSLPASSGAIRLRRPCGSGVRWSVEKFGSARHLKDFAEQ